MVTFVCPMCDAKLDNEVRYKEHVHGKPHGKGRFTPATCTVGKEAHFGLKMQAKEMTQALEQLPLAPSDLLSIVDTLRGMKPPPAIVKTSSKPPTPDEIAKMSMDDLQKVFNELEEILLQPRKRVVTEKPDSELYFRYDEHANPIQKLYVGSGKTEYESGERKMKRSRKDGHDSATKKAKRESKAAADIKPLKYVTLIDHLCEETARTTENVLFWSFHPSRLIEANRSPPQYLGRIKDKESGEWRDATHKEMRELVCPVFVEKLRALGLSLAPAATIVNETGSDEEEEESALGEAIKRAEETPMKQGKQKKHDTIKTPANKTSSSPPVTTTKKKAAAKKAISKTGNPNASSATAASQRVIKREDIEKTPANKAPATLPTTKAVAKKVVAKKVLFKAGKSNASSQIAVSQRAIKRECVEERGKSIGPSSVQAVGKSSRQEVPTKRKQVISKVSQRATVQSGASHKTTGATTEILPVNSSKRTAQVVDAPPKKLAKFSSCLASTSTQKKGEKR